MRRRGIDQGASALRTARRGCATLAGMMGVIAVSGAYLPATAQTPPMGTAIPAPGSLSDGPATAPVAGPLLPGTEMLYAVSAHPDDEPTAWWLIENRPQTFCDHGAKALGCARVWATREGARVVFDAGDQQLSTNEVVRGLDLVRDQRARWGLPTALPEVGVVAAVPGSAPGCVEHEDHSSVQDAVYGHDFDAGPQWGVVCDPSDLRFQENPAPPKPFDPIDLRMNMIDPVTEQRQGTYNINYGWLFDTYGYSGSTGMAWQRFG